MALPPPAAAASDLVKLFLLLLSLLHPHLWSRSNASLANHAVARLHQHTTMCFTSIDGWLTQIRRDFHSFSFLGLPPRASYHLATSTHLMTTKCLGIYMAPKVRMPVLCKKGLIDIFYRINVDSNRASPCKLNIHPLSFIPIPPLPTRQCPVLL